MTKSKTWSVPYSPVPYSPPYSLILQGMLEKPGFAAS